VISIASSSASYSLRRDADRRPAYTASSESRRFNRFFDRPRRPSSLASPSSSLAHACASRASSRARASNDAGRRAADDMPPRGCYERERARVVDASSGGVVRRRARFASVARAARATRDVERATARRAAS